MAVKTDNRRSDAIDQVVRTVSQKMKGKAAVIHPH
jgi:hypothetical protein